MAGREIVATMWDAHAWLWYGYEVSTHTVLKLYTNFQMSKNCNWPLIPLILNMPKEGCNFFLIDNYMRLLYFIPFDINGSVTYTFL